MRAPTYFLALFSFLTKITRSFSKNHMLEEESNGRRENIIMMPNMNNNAPSISISLINPITPTTTVKNNPSIDNFIIIPPPSSTTDNKVIVVPPSGLVFPDMNNAPFMGISLLNTDAPTATNSKEILVYPTKNPTILTLNPTSTKSPSISKKEETTITETSSQTVSSTSNPTTGKEEIISKVSISPTIPPTLLPTENKPTNRPSFSTAEVYPAYWFNYNPISKYGPNNWPKLDELGNDNVYLNYIGDDSNECDKDDQSPIDLRTNSKCMDDHTPAALKGKNKFEDLDFSIESSSLRVILQGNEDDNPKLDFSNLSDFLPAAFVHVKVPAEHVLHGKNYAGELQIYHNWDKGNGRFVVVSILMDDSENKEHTQFEQFLREWEEVSWKKKNDCDRLINPGIPPYIRTYARLSAEEMEKIWGVQPSDERSDYDIHRFMTTGWYCGYNGSLTEPPCSRRVHWRILDVPMKVSKMQVERIQNLILGRLNGNCEQETAAYSGSVNRPIQKITEDVWCCTSFDWKFRTDKDPLYWFESWPSDYHGWNKIEDQFTPLGP